MLTSDITKTVISSDVIRQRIATLFSDSVILDNHLNIVSISQNIVETTGYTREELIGQSISCFSHSNDLQFEISERLRPGYFEEEEFEIQTKHVGTLLYAVSGFYLGLLADVSGLIVLKLKSLDEINLMYNRLEAKTMELDRFVYLSSHALRGPLATLRGLINIAKSGGPDEMPFLINTMDDVARKLDDKFYRLIYFAEADKGSESSGNPILLRAICEALAANVREASLDYPVNYQYVLQDNSGWIDNGEVVLALLRNLLIFACSQPKEGDNLLKLDIHKSSSAAEILLVARRFKFSASLVEKLKAANFGYSELLSHPELLNCYAVKKIIFKLKGDIQFLAPPSGELVVLISLPIKEQNGAGLKTA